MSAQVPTDPVKAKLSGNRLIEAISPQLFTELDRMLEEFRQKLEAEATVRLKKALLDKESEFRTRTDEETHRVRSETSDRIRSEVTTLLEARFAGQLTSELEKVKQEMGIQAREALEGWQKERLDLVSKAEQLRVLYDFHSQVWGAASQSEILRRFMVAADRLSSGVAVYLNRDDGLARWETKGEAAFPELISQETIDPEWRFEEIVVRSRTVAAVCAAGVTGRESFDGIVTTLQRAIENFGLRSRFFGPGGISSSPPNPAKVAASKPPDQPQPESGSDQARQLARTLVSEIKLGHEKEVLEGRAHADMYIRLQNVIEAARAAYRSQVKESGTDYFHDELVKILADNDPQRLGVGYPGHR